MIKTYWTLWAVLLTFFFLMWAGGMMTAIAFVAFGFVAFGLTFAGMICVLPLTVAHPTEAKAASPRAVREAKETKVTMPALGTLKSA